MKPMTQLSARAVALLADHVDTDQIIPARFLKVTDKENLGLALFADWRKDPGFILNQPSSVGAEVLICGDNFGCGSSREHAPWALGAFGFRVLVSTRFADIFRNNALGNGILPVVVTPEVHQGLVAAHRDDPEMSIHVDVSSRRLRFGSHDVRFPLDAFSQHRLIHGLDTLDYLLTFKDEIAAYEEGRIHG